MKFPLARRPFGRVELSPQQCETFEALATDVVDATLDERARFIHFDKRVLSRKLYKPVKTRDDVTVFKRVALELDKKTRTQPAESARWGMPKMLAVGTIAGTLDDVMYGIVTPDAPTIAVKTSYVNDELLDSAVLHTIRGATTQDPYQFLGLKWMVKGHTATINSVVWPRDFVFVEATGLRVRPGGHRIGFHAMHSVDVAQCGSLEPLGIVRCRFSSCCVYRERAPGTVEVYMMTFVDPGGNSPEVIAVLSTANTMVGIWKAVWCAQNKKLAWLLANDAARRPFHEAAYLVNRLSDGSCCALCSKSFRSFRTGVQCQLCAARVCSRCCIARKLSSSDESLRVAQRVVEVCKSCVARVANADAFEIACEQYVASESREPATDETATRANSSASSAASQSSKGSEPDVAVETLEDWERASKKVFSSVSPASGDELLTR